jgi:hypothetical protein
LPHFCYLNVHRIAATEPARVQGIGIKWWFSSSLGKLGAMVFKLHFP